MNYTEFTDAIVKNTQNAAGKECRIFINQVVKNNNTRLDGLVIMEKDRNMSPTIYLNDFYPKYKKGMSIEKITDEILSGYYNYRDTFDMNTDFLSSFENVREKIAYKLINRKMNEELLKKIPHKTFLDLAVVYYIYLSDKDGALASTLIYNSYLEAWETDLKTIDEQARINTPKLFKARIRPIDRILENAENNSVSGLKAEDEIDESDYTFPESLKLCDPYKSMYVLTNESGLHGAACILYKRPLSLFGKKINRDFYVLPSSVHEVIIVPKFSDLRKEDLSCMVRDINKTGVSPEEVLSDNVYEYDISTDTLKM